MWKSPWHFVQSDSGGVQLVQAIVTEKKGADNTTRIALPSPSVFSLVIILHCVSQVLGGRAVLHSHQLDLVLIRIKGMMPGEGERKKSGPTASKAIPASLMAGDDSLVE